jgi:hypothetical protein
VRTAALVFPATLFGARAAESDMAVFLFMMVSFSNERLNDLDCNPAGKTRFSAEVQETPKNRAPRAARLAPLAPFC